MPLEISEIGVQLAVRSPNEIPTPATHNSSTHGPAAMTSAQQEEIVAECVRRVLQTLRMQEAR